MFRRLGRDHLEALEFLVGRLARLFRHLGGFDFLLDFLELARARIAVAEFLLNRLQLLAQIVLALILVEFGLNLRLDLVPELEQLDFAGQNRNQLLQPLTNIGAG